MNVAMDYRIVCGTSLTGPKRNHFFFQKKDQKGTKKVKIFTKKGPPAGTERR